MDRSTHCNGDGAAVPVVRQDAAGDSGGASVVGLLLPCPFCGGRANYEVKESEWDKALAFQIWCDCLRACVIEPTHAAAVRKWNQRHLGLVSLSPALKKAAVVKWQRVKRRKSAAAAQ